MVEQLKGSASLALNVHVMPTVVIDVDHIGGPVSPLSPRALNRPRCEKSETPRPHTLSKVPLTLSYTPLASGSLTQHLHQHQHQTDGPSLPSPAQAECGAQV